MVVYSLRAQAAPFVSMPVDWDTLAAAAGDEGAAAGLRWTAGAAIEALEATGDRFAPVLSAGAALPGTDVGSDHS